MNYLIYGEEKYLIDNEITKIINTNKIDKDSIYKLDIEEVGIDRLIEELNTYDLFSNTKLIIANNCSFLSTKPNKECNSDLLLEYIKNPNSSSFLIITLNDKLDERKKINKELKNICKTIKCDKINDFELEKYIESKFHNNNYKITKLALNEFINRVTKDLYNVNNEINKLMMYKIDTKEINEEDIKNCISKKIYDDVFLFVESVINNDKKKMFEIYNDLVNYHNEEIIKLINLIYTQFRLIYQVSILKKDGLKEEEISKKLNVHPYRVKLIFKNKNIDENKIIKYIYDLCELDLNIKSGNTNKIVAFELFLLSI